MYRTRESRWCATAKEITAEGVIMSRDGKEELIRGDTVVIATGARRRRFSRGKSNLSERNQPEKFAGMNKGKGRAK